MEPFYIYVYKAIHHTARKQEGLTVKNYKGSWEREDSLNWLKEETSEHNSTNIGSLYKKCELALSLRSLGCSQRNSGEVFISSTCQAVGQKHGWGAGAGKLQESIVFLEGI